MSNTQAHTGDESAIVGNKSAITDEPRRNSKGGLMWKPGQSGNPSGRPKTPPEVKALFAAAVPDVAKALIATALDSSHKHHVQAAIHVLERALGKVPDKIQHSGAEGGPISLQAVQSLSDAELMQRASEIVSRRLSEVRDE